MASLDQVVDAVLARVLDILRKENGGGETNHVYGVYVEVEAVGSLHKVLLPGGQVARFVPAFAHVTGLAAGQTLMMVRDKGVPLTIIGRVTGDITLASI